MPSLRRTISSPSVRSSPYPALSSAVNNPTATRGNGRRRSSGSESTGRRVLADIEWWRVADGQCDLDADHESDDNNRDHLGQSLVIDDLLASTGFPSVNVGGVERLPAVTPLVQGSQDAIALLPTNNFAALSITPHTPTRRQHSRESSFSLESTPETDELSFAGLRLNIPNADLGLPEATVPALNTRRRGYRAASAPFLSVRAHCFDDFLSLHNDAEGSYADFSISPLSSGSPQLFN